MFIKKTFQILVASTAIFLFVACEEDENVDTPTETAQLACTHYVDSGTYAYFECVDFSETTETNADVAAFCDDQNSGTTSVSCSEAYVVGGGTYPSTGSCAYEDSNDQLTGRWYYAVVGDGPSESALCDNLSGTFTED